MPTAFGNLVLTKLWLFCGDGSGCERSKIFGVQKNPQDIFAVDGIVEETFVTCEDERPSTRGTKGNAAELQMKPWLEPPSRGRVETAIPAGGCVGCHGVLERWSPVL